jgi:pimeloyl-ACP methyl ester carboxylesterase
MEFRCQTQKVLHIKGIDLPTIVMLPGMDGTGDLFAPIIAELDSSVAAIVVRYPDAPLGYAALIAHARNSLPATGDFFLLGESFSGPVAVALAAEGNPRLRGLILSAAFITNPLRWTRPIAPLVEVAPVTGTPATLLTRLLLGQFSTPSRRTMIAASLAQNSRATIRARLRAIAEVDMRDQLAAVTVPILYLRASHDRIVPDSAGNLVIQIKPETTLVTVQAPHFLLQVGSREAADAICAFLGRRDI